MTPQQAVVKMRKMAKSPSVRAEMQAGWNAVCDKLEAHYAAMRPKPRSFEVHHMNEIARGAYAVAVVEGKSIEECTALAVAKIINKDS